MLTIKQISFFKKLGINVFYEGEKLIKIEVPPTTIYDPSNGIASLYHGTNKNNKAKFFSETKEVHLFKIIYNNVLKHCSYEKKIKDLMNNGNTLKESSKKVRGLKHACIKDAYQITNLLIKLCIESLDQEALKVARKYHHSVRGKVYVLCKDNKIMKELCDQFPLIPIIIENLPLELKIIALKKIEEGIKTTKLLSLINNLVFNYKEAIHNNVMASEYVPNVQNFIENLRIRQAHGNDKTVLEYELYPSLKKVKHRNCHNYHKQQKLFSDKKLIDTYFPKTSLEQLRWMKLLLRLNHWENLDLTPIKSWFLKNADFKIKFTELYNEIHSINDYMIWRQSPYVNLAEIKASYKRVLRESIEWHRTFHNRQQFFPVGAIGCPTVKTDFKFPEPWLSGLVIKKMKEEIAIVPIKSFEDLIEEGSKMHHCVSSYASSIENNSCYIYSIEINQKKTATLELRTIDKNINGNMIKLFHNAQLRGPCNAAVKPMVNDVVNDWLKNENKKLLKVVNG